MKYLSTVLLLSCSVMSLSSSAFADEDTCATDAYNAGKCAYHDVEHGAVALKNKLMPGITQAKIVMKTSGDVFLDEGKKGYEHLVAAKDALAEPWDFSNLKEEKNQDVAHAVGDFGKGIGKDAKKIGLGIWHGLHSLGTGTKNETITVVDAEKAGFAGREPDDVVTALADTFKGTKNVAIVTSDGVKHVFQRTIGNEFQEKYRSESEKERIKEEDKKLLHDLVSGPQGAPQGAIAEQVVQKPDRSPAVVGDLNGTPEPVAAAGVPK